jgi:hypothetical protein
MPSLEEMQAQAVEMAHREAQAAAKLALIQSAITLNCQIFAIRMQVLHMSAFNGVYNAK